MLDRTVYKYGSTFFTTAQTDKSLEVCSHLRKYSCSPANRAGKAQSFEIDELNFQVKATERMFLKNFVGPRWDNVLPFLPHRALRDASPTLNPNGANKKETIRLIVTDDYLRGLVPHRSIMKKEKPHAGRWAVHHEKRLINFRANIKPHRAMARPNSQSRVAR